MTRGERAALKEEVGHPRIIADTAPARSGGYRRWRRA
jgi:hypothetical protein